MKHHKVGTVCAASKLGGQKDGNEYCSPEIGSLLKLLKRISRSADPFPAWGRPKFYGKKRSNAP
jgi:hypothetical protein